MFVLFISWTQFSKIKFGKYYKNVKQTKLVCPLAHRRNYFVVSKPPEGAPTLRSLSPLREPPHPAVWGATVALNKSSIKLYQLLVYALERLLYSVLYTVWQPRGLRKNSFHFVHDMTSRDRNIILVFSRQPNKKHRIERKKKIWFAWNFFFVAHGVNFHLLFSLK